MHQNKNISAKNEKKAIVVLAGNLFGCLKKNSKN